MNTAEPTIDRSIDQTAKHEHIKGRTCQVCDPEVFQIPDPRFQIPDSDSGEEFSLGEHIEFISYGGPEPAVAAAETPSRPAATAKTLPSAGTPHSKHVSPAVLEFRISEITESLIDMTKRAVVAEARFKVAEERIEQFKKLTASLALELDKYRAADDEARLAE